MNPRIVLVLTAAVFVLSPLLAWLVHIGVVDVGLEAGQGKNRGELIHPARPLQGFGLLDAAGNNIGRDDFLGKWSLFEVAERPCVDDCMKNIYKMRQVRLAIGKDAYRVQRVVIAEQGTDLMKLQQDNPGTLVYRISDDSKPLLVKFPGYIEGGIAGIGSRIYIIDPLGNLMMRYAKNADPSDILKDLRQLLKATWIRPIEHE